MSTDFDYVTKLVVQSLLKANAVCARWERDPELEPG